MNFKNEFDIVDQILQSNSLTKGVDAFSLSLIKAERQMRKLFTHLVSQNPEFDDLHKKLRQTLADHRNVYFDGFISGIENMYPVKVSDLIGDGYENLKASLENAISIRNKIFHGQVTTGYLDTENLVTLINEIKRWCRLLADSSLKEFGYDGFGRNSMQKSQTGVYSKFLVRVNTIDEYRNFIKRYMTSRRDLTKEELAKANRPYYLIEKKEVVNGFMLCATNARHQFDSALRIKTEIGNMGLANSLMILSAEEAIKAFTLLAIRFDVPVPFLIKSIFAQHQAKHIRGKELNEFIRVLSFSISIFSRNQKDQLSGLLDLVLEVVSITGNEGAWWDAANDSKNDGLYVGFSRQTFQSPTKFKDEAFNKSKEIVGRFIRLLERATTLIEK